VGVYEFQSRSTLHRCEHMHVRYSESQYKLQGYTKADSSIRINSSTAWRSSSRKIELARNRRATCGSSVMTVRDWNRSINLSFKREWVGYC